MLNANVTRRPICCGRRWSYDARRIAVLRWIYGVNMSYYFDMRRVVRSSRRNPSQNEAVIAVQPRNERPTIEAALYTLAAAAEPGHASCLSSDNMGSSPVDM